MLDSRPLEFRGQARALIAKDQTDGALFFLRGIVQAHGAIQHEGLYKFYIRHRRGITAEMRILWYRYIDGLSWDRIAEKMQYSQRFVLRIHSKALRSLEEMGPGPQNGCS